MVEQASASILCPHCAADLQFAVSMMKLPNGQVLEALTCTACRKPAMLQIVGMEQPRIQAPQPFFVKN